MDLAILEGSLKKQWPAILQVTIRFHPGHLGLSIFIFSFSALINKNVDINYVKTQKGKQSTSGTAILDVNIPVALFFCGESHENVGFLVECL